MTLGQAIDGLLQSSRHQGSSVTRDTEHWPEEIGDLWKMESIKGLQETDSFISLLASRLLEGVQ